MREINLNSTGKFSLQTAVLPCKEELSKTDLKKYEDRIQDIHDVLEEVKKDYVYLKLNRGINRGSIIKVPTSDSSTISFTVIHYDVSKQAKEKVHRYHIPKNSPYTKFEYSDTIRCMMRSNDRLSQHVVKFDDGNMIHLDNFYSLNMSLLIGYNGPQVFKINEDVRPLTFYDRLDQEIFINDLVVIANHYGELDVGIMKGFYDNDHIFIEACDTKKIIRIKLKNNKTKNCMKMQQKLKDIAMMMKLSAK